MGGLALAIQCRVCVKLRGAGSLAHRKELDGGLGQSLIQALYAD